MPLNLPHKHTKTTSSHTNIYYKTEEIRFGDFANSSYKKLPRRLYTFQSDPWMSFDNQQIQALLNRLDDKPEHLYQTIEQKRKRGKFTLLRSPQQKQNLKLIQLLQSKKHRYEQEVQSILRHRKPQALTIILPKLSGVSYTYGDNLHEVQSKKPSKRIIE